MTKVLLAGEKIFSPLTFRSTPGAARLLLACKQILSPTDPKSEKDRNYQNKFKKKIENLNRLTSMKEN